MVVRYDVHSALGKKLNLENIHIEEAWLDQLGSYLDLKFNACMAR